MKRLCVLVCCFLLAWGLAGCGNDEKKVLRVGTTANFPPFEYMKPNSDVFLGFDIDLMKNLASLLGYDEVEFINVGFHKLIDGLEAKQYDVVISGLAITPEREARVAFTRPYITDGLTIVLPVGTKLPNEAASLRRKRVAVESGSIAFDWVVKNTDHNNIVVTDSTEEAIKAVVDNKADCMVASKLSVAYLLANGFSDSVRFAGDNILLADEIAIAVHKDNKELLQKLNAELEKYCTSASYRNLCRTYFGSMK